MLMASLCGSEEAGARERVANLQLAVMHCDALLTVRLR